MSEIKKLFFMSEELLFKYEYLEDGTRMVGHILVRAAPEVTWQDIVSEVDAHRAQDDLFLKTCTYEHENFHLAYTVGGFLNLAAHQFQYPGNDKGSLRNSMENIAKELVATRDHQAAGGYESDKRLTDFWPEA